MPRSLLDDVDLAALRAAAAGSPAQRLLRCLLDAGAVQHDPAEPDWPDRDRVVLAGDALAAAAVDAFAGVGYPPGQGFIAVGEDVALGTALGLGLASRLEGAIFRVLCLLPVSAMDLGGSWEAVIAAGQEPVDPLTVFVLDAPSARLDLAGLLTAAGWSVSEGGRDPLELLAALDHAFADARPAAILLPGADET